MAFSLGQSFKFDPRFSLPNNFIYAGATNCGKTTLLMQTLENATKMYNPVPKRVYFMYSCYQQSYTDLRVKLEAQGINCIFAKASALMEKDLDAINIKYSDGGQNLIVVDDNSIAAASSNEMAHLFTICRHKNCSMVLLLHFLFVPFPSMRLISNNTAYFVLLKSPRMAQQVANLGTQINMRKELIHAYKTEMKKLFGHVLVDLQPTTPDQLRIRSGLLNTCQTVYIPSLPETFDCQEAKTLSQIQGQGVCVKMKRKTAPPKSQVAHEPPSKIVSKEELALFDPVPEQNSIEHSERIEFGPNGAITETGAIVFTLPKSDTYLTDVSSIFLEVDLRVLHANGNALTASDAAKVHPTNDFFDALFSRCTVCVNNVKIGSESAYHPQVSMLKNMLSHSNGYLTDCLGDALIWYKDYSFPGTQPQVRHRWIAGSKTVKVVGRLTDSFLTSTNLLVPQAEVQITLERSPAEFCLIRPDSIKVTKKVRNNTGELVEVEEEKQVTDTYKIEMQSCMLSVHRVRLSPVKLNEIEGRLARGALARYKFTNMEGRTTQIPQGLKVWKARSLFSGKLPSRVLFGIMETESLAGPSWSNNPMIFPAAEYKVCHVNFFVDERPLLRRPYTPEFATKNYSRSYMGLLDAARVLRTGKEIAIKSDDLANCYGLFGLDLTADGSELTHSDVGNFTVEVRFSENTTRPLCGFLVGEFPSVLTLGSNGVVQVFGL